VLAITILILVSVLQPLWWMTGAWYTERVIDRKPDPCDQEPGRGDLLWRPVTLFKRCNRPEGTRWHRHVGDYGNARRGMVSGGSTTVHDLFARGLVVILLIAVLVFVVVARTGSRCETPMCSIFSLDSPKICLDYLNIDKPSPLVFPCSPTISSRKNSSNPPGGHPFSHNARVSRHDFTLEVIVLWRERTGAQVGSVRTAAGT